MASPKVYALLVAIDRYQNPVPALNGCVRDSQDVQAYLEANLASDVLDLKTVRNEEATKANVVEAFLSHLGQAGKDDIIFFHYAGHGSQEKSPPQFWHLEPDKKNETLVCYDSRRVIDGVYHRDLADKELGSLIYQVSKKEPHVVVMLDCCHSGSGSRDIDGVTPRQSPADGAKSRGLADYVFMNRPEFGEEYKDMFKDQAEVTLPVGPHILLSGAKNIQTAKELRINGKSGGIFTYSILQALKSSQGNISYRDLLKRASAFVRNKVADQDPQLEEVNINPLVQKVVGTPRKVTGNDTFLFGQGRPKDDFFFVYYDKKKHNSWIVEVGAMQGIPAPKSGEKASFAIYKPDVNIADAQDDFFAEAEVKQVEASYSLISFPGSDTIISQDETFKAAILDLPNEKTYIYLELEDEGDQEQVEGIETLRKALTGSRASKHALRYLGESEEGEADYRVMAYSEKGRAKYSIHRIGDALPLLKQVLGFTDRSADEVVQQLTAIARWDRLEELHNPGTKIAPGEVEIEVFAKERDPETGEFSAEKKIEPGANGEIQLPYYLYDPVDDDDLGASPQVRIRVNNQSSKRLHFALFYMGTDYSISNIVSHVNELGSGQFAYAIEGEFFAPEVPEELINLGIKQDATVLKLLVSTSPFDAHEWEQEGFTYPEETRGLRRKKSKSFTDWTTEQIILTAIAADTSGDESTLVDAGVTIDRPEGVDFNVSLGSLSNATRDLSRDLLPSSILVEDNSVAQPFNFVQGRSTSPNLNVLELSGITNPEKVNKDNPLVITIDQPLEKNETLMTVASDGEIMIPVFATPTADGKSQLKLESLAGPATRSLSSTFGLMIHKVFSGTLGFSEYDYPRLSMVGQEDEEMTYIFDPNTLKAAISAADRILVCVHGFTGESDGTFFGATASQGDQSFYHSLRKNYDLVLAFDYESFNTSVSNNSAGLKRRLEEMGLQEGHGKHLSILAHSLGGLVSRYYIEMLGGKSVVNHLIMCGTPNGGSPWASIKDWAFFGTTLLLNVIPGVGLAISALGYLASIASAINALDLATDDMKPDSEFIKGLKNAGDPGIPYTILAGNVPFLGRESEESNLVSRILDRIGVDEAVENWVFKDKNDLLVSTVSIIDVPGDRDPVFLPHEVVCNHFGYFTNPVAISLLEESMKTKEG